MNPKDAAKELLRRRLARKDYGAWCDHALAPLGLKPANHHRLLIRELQDVADGKTQRLMVNMPPGSAKSTFGSMLFPAWLIASKPNISIIGASNTANLAESFSRRVMGFARDNTPELGYTLTREAADDWETSNGGRYRAIGVGGAISGRRADMVVIDDPTRSRADAESSTIRENQWNWFTADLRTRLKPDASIVVIMCMTGDTPVLMADGTEKHLRNIRPGDTVATYRDGALSTSKVKNWIKHRPDNIFEIKMTSGITVRANARHPFLACIDGESKWTKLRDLRPGHEIFRVSGVNGRVKTALGKDAISRLSAEATVLLTILKSVGQMAFAHLRTILPLTVQPASSIGTASLPTNTTACIPSKAAYVPSASSRPVKMFEPIGAASCALTTAMERTGFARFSAMIATLRSAIQKRLKSQRLLPLISDFTLDKIETITPAGSEEVFDIEVAETENFIANGLVSHNTRWHMDDLGGRLLERQPGLWRVVSLPAIAEEQDPLGRKPGEWLWEDDAYGYSREIRKVHSEYMEAGASRDWAALYQQKPVLAEGDTFKPAKIAIIDAVPAGTRFVRAWDFAATSSIGTRNPDWTRGVLLGRTPDGMFVLGDVVSARAAPEEVEAIVCATASRDGRGVEISLPQDPGQAGVSQIKYFTRKLMGHRVHTSRETGEKSTRAMPFASQVNVGNVLMVRASWNHEALDEMGSFPGGMHDDIVDACSRAFDRISASGGALERARMLTQRA